MFCPKCGAKNIDGAKFCASCGNQMPQRQVAQPVEQPAEQPAAQPSQSISATYVSPAAEAATEVAASVAAASTPSASGATYAPPAAGGATYAPPAGPTMPTAAAAGAGVAGGAAAQAVAAKPGAKKPIIAAIAAVVVIVLVVLLVRLVACSGAGAPNMIDLVTKDTATVSKIVSGYDTAVFNGDTYFTTDAKALTEIYTAIMSTSSQDEAVEILRKNADIWFFALGDDYDIIDATSVKTTNPTRAGCYTVLARSTLSAKEAADILNKVAPFDQCVFYTYGSGDSTVYGYAKGGGCISEFEAEPVEDSSGNVKVYEVTITTYSISEDTSGSSESSYFDSEYTGFDASYYADSYKK